jgi:MFS family permease
MFDYSIWIYTLSGGFRSSINSSMTAYATSEFGLHSLLTIVDIVSGAMTAACYIPLAKGLDLWGRAEGFVLMVGMLTLGMVLQAAAPNLPALCAGRVVDSFSRHRFWLLTFLAGLSISRRRRCCLRICDCRSRHDQLEESWTCFRLYVFAIHDHRLHRSKSRPSF